MGTGIKGDSGDAAHLSGDGDAIKVFVRVRPLTQGTGLSTDGDPSLCLTVTSPNTIRLHSKPEPRVFTYDHVADMDVSQEAVFSSVGKNIVESCVNGYNGTIFAYGQTGSGKTFTMLGPAESDNFTHDMRGVIPRSFEYLFFLINREAEKSGNGKSFLCKCSFIEIYNEQIFDLLDSASASLFLRENIKKGVFVDGAVEKIITSAGEAYQVLSTGWRNRRVASTSMNRESSRSHAVFTVTLESKETVNEIVNIRSSQLNLVDLAGSERQKDTHAEGTRLKEAGSINRSLSCLSHVIMALVDVSNGKSRHICYRDSKLTFLLRDSLGGNARTFIIANVHPGSKCFGETLSTLHFAQRAKLIKNKAVINEDTQGNVRQLQAKVKKLKELLAQTLAAQAPAGAHRGPDHEGHNVPAGPAESGVSENEHKHRFLEAMLLWEKSESEKKNLLQKVTQLEETWAKKEKFIQSNRMILKFREDHISRLEKSLKESQGGLSSQESEAVVSQLKQEIQILREQVEQHPRVAKYAVENHSLREENQRLRSLEPVKRAQELSAQVAAELEKAFREASAAEKLPGVQPLFSTPVTAENVSSVSVERLKAQLMQKQAELTTTVQAYEEYKELTKKRLLEMESEKQYLEKANQHLENILEATQAHTRQEVSQLNKKHFETIKNLTTPTRGYYLRSRLVPHFSPDHSMDLSAKSLPAEDPVDDILNEPVPPEMNELACEALTEELETVQEQVSVLQLKLDEEEVKNRKLLQQIGKLEEHSNKMEELLSSERSNWSKEQQNLQDHISSLEKDLREEKTRTDVLRSEVHDLRLVLHSADRELLAAKAEYSSYRGAQELELSQLSSSLIHVQLQLDNVRLEHEKLLEERRSLQDSHDTLQEVMKYESEEHKQRVAESQRENAALQAELSKLLESMKTEKERNSNLTSQLKEDKETTSKELLKALDENVDLKKHISSLTVQSEQQTAELHSLKQSLTAANTRVAELEKKCETEKEFVVDILNQTQELRNTLNEKNEMLAVLSSELEDIKEKYCAALAAKEESRALIARHEKEVIDLREAMERRVSSDKIEQELLQEDLSHAAEEVEKLTKVVNEQTALLQAAQAAAAGYTALIQELQEQLKQKNELKSPKIANEQNRKTEPVLPATPLAQTQTPKTPSSFSTDLTKVLEAQEQELENRRSSIVTLEMLVKEFSAERLAQNEEILRLKAQLCEKENLRLELTDQCYTLQNQMAQNCSSSVEKDGNSHEAVMKELKEERKARAAAMAKLSELEVDLQRTSATLSSAETCIQQMTSELRDRSIELKELREKDLDHEKLAKEVDVLRKQVDFLAEENGKLVGHQNLNQKIQYLVKLKKENTKLIEDNEKLRLENFNLKESCKKIQVST